MKLFNKIIFAVVVVALGACAEPDYPTATPSVTTQTSKVTIFHAMAGGPRIQMKIDNVVTAKDTLRYESKNGKFYNVLNLAVPAGPFRLVTATNVDDSTDLITDRNTVVAGTNYTAIVYYKAGTTTPTFRRITDDLAAADVGFAKVRFLHYALDAAEVKVTDVGNVNTVFSARKYDEVSRGSGASAVDFTRFTSMPAGTVNFEVYATSGNTLLLSIPNLKLDSKSVYTIFLRGLIAGSGSTSLGYTVVKH